MKHRFSAGKLIIGIFSVILTLTLVLFLFVGYTTIRESMDITDYYSEDSYLFDLQYRNYSYLVGMTRRDAVLDKEFSPEITACRSVAGYFEAATLYKAYLEADDEEQAKRQKERMDRYAEQMVEYRIHQTYIDDMLDLPS